ncbi:hypothetical protein HYC85_019359 [Camellia sinensis]|uniref:Uncharacterized protein n=1 Tax=Camellia sinensis TaxID=4442 RepID=A0A7J7GMJ1_CAMSI|nr:hypothetical protein HYC85_019359 [Camellia sinensis]
MLIQKFLSLKLMAACKRLVQLGPSFGISFTKFRRFSSSEKQFDGSSMIFGSSSSSNSSFNRFDFRQISQLVKPNGKRVFLVDTLALVRRLEAQGVPSKQAEAITAAITEVLNDSLENVAHSLFQKQKCRKLTCFMSQTSPSLKLKYKVPSVAVMTRTYPEDSGEWKELILLQNIASYMLLACGVVYLISVGQLFQYESMI